MTSIQFASGDTFNFSDGCGIVLPTGDALLIIGQGGRTGYRLAKGAIPADALPGKPVKHDAFFALEAVATAFK